MTKDEIIRFLQKLSPCCIKCLDIAYHKMSYDSSVCYRYHYSALMPLIMILHFVRYFLSLYKLRGCIRAINLVYFDKQGQMQQLDWFAKDCVCCKTLNDFINIINFKNGKRLTTLCQSRLRKSLTLNRILFAVLLTKSKRLCLSFQTLFF